MRPPLHPLRTCPNCQQLIDLDSALGRSGWSTWAPSDYGVRCPKCKVILAVCQRPGFAVFWAVLVIVGAIILVGELMGRLSRASVGLITLGLLVFAVFMRRWRVGSLIELSVPPPGTKLREVLPSAREYAFLEGKDGRDKVFQPDPVATESELPAWTCSNCGQPNPGSLGVCWKCNHCRPVAR